MNNHFPNRTRRTLMKGLGGACLLPPLLKNLASAAQLPAIKRTIPASGESLAVIGLGTSRTFDADIGDSEVRQRLAEVLQLFFDHGGALLDSSPMYGRAESVFGDLNAQVTNNTALFSATKVWTDGRDAGVSQMQESFTRMGVSQVDLMQVHNLRDWKVHLKTLREWKDAGKIRYIGITTSRERQFADFERVMRLEPLDFVQLNYSLGEPEAEQRLLPLAADKGIATLLNRPFQRGALFGKTKGRELPAWASDFDCTSWGQFFLKWALGHPAATCAIPATSKPHHMIDNMGAGFGGLPDQPTRQRMADFFASL